MQKLSYSEIACPVCGTCFPRGMAATAPYCSAACSDEAEHKAELLSLLPVDIHDINIALPVLLSRLADLYRKQDLLTHASLLDDCAVLVRNLSHLIEMHSKRAGQ